MKFEFSSYPTKPVSAVAENILQIPFVDRFAKRMVRAYCSRGTIVQIHSGDAAGVKQRIVSGETFVSAMRNQYDGRDMPTVFSNAAIGATIEFGARLIEPLTPLIMRQRLKAYATRLYVKADWDSGPAVTSTPTTTPTTASSDRKHQVAEATTQANATAEETADWIQRGIRPGGTHDRNQFSYSRPNRDGVYRMEGGHLVYYDKNNAPRD